MHREKIRAGVAAGPPWPATQRRIDVILPSATRFSAGVDHGQHDRVPHPRRKSSGPEHFTGLSMTRVPGATAVDPIAHPLQSHFPHHSTGCGGCRWRLLAGCLRGISGAMAVGPQAEQAAAIMSKRAEGGRLAAVSTSERIGNGASDVRLFPSRRQPPRRSPQGEAAPVEMVREVAHEGAR